MADAASGPSPEEDAAAMASLTIYNLPPAPPRWDRIGIAFISWCCVWTTLVFTSMAVCLVFRNSVPALRVRCLPLSFTAIAFLHAYWILAWLVYPIGGTMPVVLAYDIQYFFMGIWFPLGIAVFHASNLRFLYVAKRQKRFMKDGVDEKDECNGAGTSILCRIRNIAYVKRVMIFIGLGMVAQVLLTVGMWVACKKYHPTFGIPGTGIRGDTLPEQMIDLGRGWEWWPSVLWQVIWTWIVAPYLIWRAWSIRDTLGWRTQTIGCCLSNLHATPMFLVASYVTAFNKVNEYFPPSQWIHLSIMMIEVFAVFIPLFQLIKHRFLARKAARLNAKWDTRSQTSGTSGTSSAANPFNDASIAGSYPPRTTSLSFAEKGSVDDGTFAAPQLSQDQQQLPLDSDDENEDRLLTMSALDRVLVRDPVPLQDFSALNDFSGENIAFLRRVAAWKADYKEHVQDDDDADEGRSLQESERLALYNRAFDIYTDFISPADAEFPLNLSSRHHDALTSVFAPALSATTTPDSSVIASATPFDLPSSSSSASNSSTRDLYDGAVPSVFGPTIFDSAQTHIKYLVLTNTWPKFVAEMHARRKRMSSDTVRSSSVATEGSGTSFLSRASSALQSLLMVKRN